MPLWVYLALAVGVIVAVALAITVMNLVRRALEKRALLHLLVHAENVDAGARTLTTLMEQLADSEDEVLELFASDPDAVDRRVLQELCIRLSVLAEELDTMALPEHMVPIAAALADAAFIISSESGRIRETDLGDDALLHVGEVDLVRVNGYAQKARAMVHDACLEYGLEDTAVYGGGLYL